MSRETYSAILEPSQSGGFGVYFPLFPGCVSYGRTRREAQANATEALELHIAGMAEDGDEIPFEEGDDEAVVPHASRGVAGALEPIFVTVEVGDKGGERVNVYMSKRLVGAVDAFASRNGMTRSSVFGIATRRYLESEATSRKVTP